MSNALSKLEVYLIHEVWPVLDNRARHWIVMLHILLNVRITLYPEPSVSFSSHVVYTCIPIVRRWYLGFTQSILTLNIHALALPCIA